MVLGAAAARVRWTTALVGLAGGIALAVGFNLVGSMRADGARGCDVAGCEQLAPAEAALLAWVGERRSAAGCMPLRVDARLQTAAQTYAAALAQDPAQASGRLTEIQAAAQARAEGAGYRGQVRVHLAVGLATADEVAGAWSRADVVPAVGRSLAMCSYTDAAVAQVQDRAAARFGPGAWVLLLGDA